MRIDVTNLSKIIRGSVILDNISIHFESGHIYGIIGKWKRKDHASQSYIWSYRSK